MPAGHHLLFFAFTNVGPGGTCSLQGYPGVEFRRNDTDTGPMPFTLVDHGGVVITSNPPSKVLVKVGQTVFAAIDKQDCVKGNNGLGPLVRVTVPGNPTITELNVPGDFTVTLCDAGDPGNTIDVSPFVPTGRDAVVVR